MFTATLDSILSQFTKLDKKLEKFIADADFEHDQITANIVNLESKRVSIINDKTRARKVQSNIKAILGE